MVRQNVKRFYSVRNETMQTNVNNVNKGIRRIQSGVETPHSKTRRILAGALAIGILLAGCSRDSVTSYEVPKEDHSVKIANSSRPHAGPMQGGEAQEPVAKVKWTSLPKGWEEAKVDDSFSVARFRISGAEGNSADVSITPLAGMARAPFAEGAILKMWAEQLGLSEPPEGAKSVPIEFGGLQGKLYDISSAATKTRMIVASVPRDGALWFVKMTGAESMVAAQQDNFKQFLKGLTWDGPASGQMAAPQPQVAAATALPPGEGHPEWKAPAAWTEVAPGNMMIAAYEVQSAKGAKAKVTVVPLGGTGGDLAANANRWRGQVGLGPATEEDLKRDVSEITLADGTKATVVHAKGAAQTLHGLVVPRGAQTWYYKILGDDEAVNAEAQHLAEFAARAK